MAVQKMSDNKNYDRIIQKELDQTAPIVYEAGKQALDSDNGVYRASLLHEEETHVNLGRTQEWIPEIDEDLQFRRPGGGSYIIHEDGSNGEGTYCFIDARIKNSSKEITGLQRDRMAYTTLKSLEEFYNEVGVKDGSYIENLDGKTVENETEAVYYNPNEGDIFFKENSMPRYDDPQIAGVGLAEFKIEDQWAQIGRVCMYPEGVSEDAIKLDREIRETLDLEENRNLDERVQAPRNPEKITDLLEETPSQELEAGEFLSTESIKRGEKLQEKEGARKADPCF
jgi:hypothetical protein